MSNEYLNNSSVTHIGLSGEIYGREKFINKRVCAKAIYSLDGVKLSSKKMPAFYRTVSKIDEHVNIVKATNVLQNTDISISALQDCLYNDTSVMNLLLRQVMSKVANDSDIDKQFRCLRTSAANSGAAIANQHVQLMQFLHAFSLSDYDKATAVWLLSVYLNFGKDTNAFIKALHKYDVKGSNACHAYLKRISHKERAKLCARINKLMCHWFAHRDNNNEFVFIVHNRLAEHIGDMGNNVKITELTHPMLSFMLSYARPDRVVATHNVVAEGTRKHVFALSKRDRKDYPEFRNVNYLMPLLVDEWIKVIALVISNPYLHCDSSEQLCSNRNVVAQQYVAQQNEDAVQQYVAQQNEDAVQQYVAQQK